MLSPLSTPPNIVNLIFESPEVFLEKNEVIKGRILQVLQDGSISVELKGKIFNAEVSSLLTPNNRYDFEVVRLSPKLLLNVKNDLVSKDADRVTISNATNRGNPSSSQSVRADVLAPLSSSGKNIIRLSAGESARASVFSASGDGKVSLFFDGMLFDYKTDAVLSEGDELIIKMLERDSGQKLFVEKAGSLFLSSPEALKKLSTLSLAITRLMNRFCDQYNENPTTDTHSKKAFLNVISKFIYKGRGEGQLKTLMSFLNNPYFSSKRENPVSESDNPLDLLIKSFRSVSSASSASFQDEIENFINKSEVFRQGTSEGFIPLPFMFNGELGVAGLWYETYKGRDGNVEAGSFVISLEMSALGQVDTWIKTYGKSLVISFRTDRDETCSTIKSELNLLRAALDKQGYIIKGINVNYSDMRIDRNSQADEVDFIA